MAENPNSSAYKETDWNLVDEVEATMSPNHDRLIIRQVTGIAVEQLNLAVADLRQRTSESNPAGEDMNYVDDPQVGSEGPQKGARVFSGRWRGVSVRGNITQGKGTITQTLAYGLVITDEALPTSELVATVNKLIRPHAINGTPTLDGIEVRYRGIDPDYVQTLEDTIAKTGGIVETQSVRQQDGSYNIHALTETVTWTAFNVATPDTTDRKNMGSDSEGRRQVWAGIANDDALTGAYTTSLAGYRITDVSVSDQLDGSVTVVRDLIKANAFVAGSPDLTWYDNKTTEHEIRYDKWSNISLTDTLTDLYTATSPTDHNVMRVRMDDNRNGTMEIVRQQWNESDFTTANDNTLLKPHSTNTGTMTRTFVEKRNYLTKPTEVPVASGITKFTATPNSNGLWDSMQVTEVVTWTNDEITLVGLTWEQMQDSNPNGHDYTKQYVATGVPIANAEALKALIVADSTWAFVGGVYTEVGNNIVACFWRDQGNGEAHIFKVVRQDVSDDYGAMQVAATADSGSQPESETRAWLHVLKSGISAVITLAKAYVGETGTLEHKGWRRTDHADGSATVEALAWEPPGSKLTGDWSSKTDLLKHTIKYQNVPYADTNPWSYYTEKYNVTYHYSEGTAWYFIHGGLSGSSVTPVSNFVWRSIFVTKIKQSAWYPGPVDTGAYSPPTSI